MFYALFVQWTTTLILIVELPLSIDYEVDCYFPVTDETYNIRGGYFYSPMACLFGLSFFGKQYSSNTTNKFGEKLLLALMQSVDIFYILELHGAALVYFCFGHIYVFFLGKNSCCQPNHTDSARYLRTSIFGKAAQLVENLKIDRIYIYNLM